jgi:hypothetical protein
MHHAPSAQVGRAGQEPLPPTCCLLLGAGRGEVGSTPLPPLAGAGWAPQVTPPLGASSAGEGCPVRAAGTPLLLCCLLHGHAAWCVSPCKVARLCRRVGGPLPPAQPQAHRLLSPAAGRHPARCTACTLGSGLQTAKGLRGFAPASGSFETETPCNPDPEPEQGNTALSPPQQGNTLRPCAASPALGCPGLQVISPRGWTAKARQWPPLPAWASPQQHPAAAATPRPWTPRGSRRWALGGPAPEGAAEAHLGICALRAHAR